MAKAKKKATNKKTVEGKSPKKSKRLEVKKKTVKAKKKPVKKKVAEPEIKPFSNVDEEIHKINKKLKTYSKEIGLPAVEVKAEMEIQQEMTKMHRLLHAANKIKLYAASYTVGLGVLAYLLGTPKSFFWHFTFACFLLWMTQHFHKHNKHYTLSLKVFYVGIFIIPIYILYSQLNDLLSLVMCVLYMICFVIAIALYFHHTSRNIKRELHQSFTKTFLVEWYSHVIALSIAILIGYYLPNLIMPNHFVSVMYTLLLWSLPMFFVYFYINKFLYLRFFDPVHIKRDSGLALKHAIAYTVLFTTALALIYLLTAVNISINERDMTLSDIDKAQNELGMLKTDIINYSETTYDYEINELEITKELLQQADQITQSLEARKSLAAESLGVKDYFSDEYYTILANKRIGTLFLIFNTADITETKDDLIRAYQKQKEGRLNFTELKGFVDTEYSAYSESQDLKDFRDKIYKNKDNYDGLMWNDELFTFTLSQSEQTGMNFWAPGTSLFSKKMYFLWSHLKIFRDSMYMAFETIVYSARDLTNPEILDLIYHNREISESETSKTVRYKILEENWKATPAYY